MELIVMVVLWLLSYFLSKKKGASDGQAALIATGVTAGAYYTGATKAVADGLTNLGGSSSTMPGTSPDPGAVPSVTAGTGAWKTIGSIGSTALTTAGSVATSWGPAGTIGAIAAASTVSSWKEYIPLGLLALGAFFILK